MQVINKRYIVVHYFTQDKVTQLVSIVITVTNASTCILTSKNNMLHQNSSSHNFIEKFSLSQVYMISIGEPLFLTCDTTYVSAYVCLDHYFCGMVCHIRHIQMALYQHESACVW